tara:strand:+ start:1529 stop:1990 length:462 start_codon:yes stop_codon:yes gene_type:complete
MKIRNEVFCKESTYILECLVRQDPDHFLKGDWYDMFPSSTIEYLDDGSVQVNILVSAIETLIKGVIGNFIEKDGSLEAKYKNIHMDKVSLYAEDYSDNSIKEGDKIINLHRDVKRIIVRKMREAFEDREFISEAQRFNDSNIYDGTDLIGFRD